MLGDDLNATVTTERFGFGAVFGHAQEGVGACAERLGGLTRGKRKQRQWSLTKGHGDKGVLLVSEKERREGFNWSERRSTRTSGLTTGQRRQREKR